MQPGDLIADRFEIEALAGIGGMGSVYRAHDRATNGRVAIKVLLRESVHAARFLREAELLCKLDHPGIVRYVGHGAPGSGGPAYLAMEWLEGVSLREHLDRGRVDAEQSVGILRQSAEALAVAHGLGVVHRDIKPENLFLVDGRADRVKILDFGVALTRSAGHRMTRTGTPIGTIGYMAPEQVHGDANVDARADVFALGAVLFECLTAQPAFAADQPLGVLAKLMFEDPPPLKDLLPGASDELAELVSVLLAKDKHRRPADASAVVALLSSFGAASAWESVTPSRRRPSLTASERQVVTAVVSISRGDESAATLPADACLDDTDGLRDISARHGGRFELLASSSFVAVFSGHGAASDAAVRAARCALELSKAEPARPIALVTGYAIAGGGLPMALLIERGMSLAGASEEGSLPLDDVTAGLLPTSFSLESSPSGLRLVAEREAAPPARLLLGRATACVGRDRELEMLRAITEECLAERVAGAVIVSGPAGIGKSRIRHELLGRLIREKPAPEIWIGRGTSFTRGSPFALLSSALRRAFGLVEESPELGQRKLRARVSRHVPIEKVDQVACFLGEAIGLRFGDAPHPWLRAARRDPILMADQIQRAWETLLEHECRAHPLVLVLEDLQWGDLPTVKLVDGVLARLPEAPLLVLALGRPELHDLFPALWSERSTHHIRVRELPRRAALQIVRSALGTGLSDEEVSELVDTAGGNALFLEELIRARAEGRSDTPGSVLAMVQTRVENLEPAARLLLRAGSIFGDQFWAGGVQALVSDLEPESISEWLSTLVEREVLTRRAESRFKGELEYTFHSTLLRDATYAMLTESDRDLGHRLAAAWLEAHGEHEPRLLADHHERGGVPVAAIPWWERAALGALDANDFAAARECAARGIAAGAGGESLGSLLLVESDALRWTGALDEALATLERALGLLPQGSPRWHQGLAEHALLLQRLGRVEELERLARHLLASSIRTPNAEGLGYAMTRAALFCLISGKSELAEQLIDHVSELEASGGLLEAATRAQRSVYRALRALYRGDLAAYLDEELEARRWFEEAGDSRRALNESTSIGYAYLELGAYEEADRTLSEAASAAEHRGLVHVQAAALHNLGLVHAGVGRFPEALEAEQRALGIFRAQSDHRLEGAALAYLAIIELAAGDFESAARTAREAAELVERVAPPIEPLARAVLALATLRTGDAERAHSEAERALAKLEALGISEAAETWARLAWAETSEALHGQAVAESAYRHARRRLRERAARIDAPARRASFLCNVPENVRTLELAARFGESDEP